MKPTLIVIVVWMIAILPAQAQTAVGLGGGLAHYDASPSTFDPSFVALATRGSDGRLHIEGRLSASLIGEARNAATYAPEGQENLFRAAVIGFARILPAQAGSAALFMGVGAGLAHTTRDVGGSPRNAFGPSVGLSIKSTIRVAERFDLLAGVSLWRDNLLSAAQLNTEQFLGASLRL